MTIQLYTALGTKCLATEEFSFGWDDKRLNSGVVNNNLLVSITYTDAFISLTQYNDYFYAICKTNGQGNSYLGFEQQASYNYDQVAGDYSKYFSADVTIGSKQVNVHSLQQRTIPTLIGKG